MSVLVTGGAGFIGSHVAERLAQQGERVVVLDNFNDYYDPALKRANADHLRQYEAITVIEGDVRDADLLARIYKGYGVRKVAHMAAMAGVRSSVDQVELYMSVNTMGTMQLLEAARHNHVELFVLASTSSVYGETQRLPFTEDDTADRPLAAYPASKRSAEILAHTYYHLFQMNINVLRFFNVYGPAGRPDMMPMKVMNAITAGEAINVFGDGELKRDWTYIDDTVDGVCAALERPMGYEVMNLGVGQPISLNAFIQRLEELAGKTAILNHVPAPASDPLITFCNNQKARELLDFDPKTTITMGLGKMWDWFVKQS